MRQHMALDCHVFQMVLFQIGCGFYFDKPPTVFLAALQNVNLNDYALMLKRTLKYCRNCWICDQLSGGADRLIQPTRTANLDAARKQLTGKHSDIPPLFDNGFVGT